jgi:hypothetical protein
MTKTIFRSLSSDVRRTPRPRITRSASSSGGFDGLLAKLGFASQQLKAARKRRSR